jgi:hypothetical protein
MQAASVASLPGLGAKRGGSPVSVRPRVAIFLEVSLISPSDIQRIFCFRYISPRAGERFSQYSGIWPEPFGESLNRLSVLLSSIRFRPHSVTTSHIEGNSLLYQPSVSLFPTG